MLTIFGWTFWDWRTVQRSASCRSRRELSNEYLLAKIGVDTAENEPCKVCPLSAYRFPGSLLLLLLQIPQVFFVGVSRMRAAMQLKSTKPSSEPLACHPWYPNEALWHSPALPPDFTSNTSNIECDIEAEKRGVHIRLFSPSGASTPAHSWWWVFPTSIFVFFSKILKAWNVESIHPLAARSWIFSESIRINCLDSFSVLWASPGPRPARLCQRDRK